jgi:hypothetical protein
MAYTSHALYCFVRSSGFFFAGFEKLRITAPLRLKRLDNRQDRRRLALCVVACAAQIFCAVALKICGSLHQFSLP